MLYHPLNYAVQYLVHWPAAMKPGEELIPKDEHGVPLVDTEVTHQQTWSAMYDNRSMLAGSLLTFPHIGRHSLRQERSATLV